MSPEKIFVLTLLYATIGHYDGNEFELMRIAVKIDVNKIPPDAAEYFKEPDNKAFWKSCLPPQYQGHHLMDVDSRAIDEVVLINSSQAHQITLS